MRRLWGLFGTFCLAWLAPCDARSATIEPAGKFALLIAIADYGGSGLDSLQGPTNDIALINDVLIERFGFKSGDIKTLINDKATHSKIHDAFIDLAAKLKAGRGDFVYIHYSGHGSTTPDPLDRRGEDQTWVSYGARAGTSTATDSYDIVDKEIALWMADLYALTDNVIFVSDSCHSATVAKGERQGSRGARRDVRPNPLLAGIRRIPDPNVGIRIGAARDIESAVEVDPLTRDPCTSSKRCNGVFTWYWAQQLREAGPQQTWGELFERTFALVTTDAGMGQRPQMEGERDAAIFGGSFLPMPATLAVMGVDNVAQTVRLGAGASAAVSPGSRYHLYRPAARNAVATLQISSVQATESVGHITSGNFHVADLVVEDSHVYASAPIRLFFGGDFAQGIDAQLLRTMQTAFSTAPGFSTVADRRQADLWIYVSRSDESSPATLAADAPRTLRLPSSSSASSAPVAWVVSKQGVLMHPRLRVPVSDTAGVQTLRERLQTMAWAQEIKRLGAHGSNIPVQVSVSVQRPDSAPPAGSCGGSEAAHATTVGTFSLNELSRTLRRCDVLGFTLQNRDADRSFYAYVIAVGPDAAVKRLHPNNAQNEDEARIERGKSTEVGRHYRLTDVGVETLILIVTRAPIDPRKLEQAGLNSRSDRPTSQLEAILMSAGRNKGDIEAPVEEWGGTAANIDVEAL